MNDASGTTPPASVTVLGLQVRRRRHQCVDDVLDILAAALIDEVVGQIRRRPDGVGTGLCPSVPTPVAPLPKETHPMNGSRP